VFQNGEFAVEFGHLCSSQEEDLFGNLGIRAPNSVQDDVSPWAKW